MGLWLLCTFPFAKPNISESCFQFRIKGDKADCFLLLLLLLLLVLFFLPPPPLPPPQKNLFRLTGRGGDPETAHERSLVLTPPGGFNRGFTVAGLYRKALAPSGHGEEAGRVLLYARKKKASKKTTLSASNAD